MSTNYYLIGVAPNSQMERFIEDNICEAHNQGNADIVDIAFTQNLSEESIRISLGNLSKFDSKNPKITKVNYRALVNLGNYENEACELEAQVSEGEDWQAVLEGLKEKACTQLGRRERYLNLRKQVDDKKQELESIEAALTDAKYYWEQAVNFLKSQGLDIKDTVSFPTFALSLIPDEKPSEPEEDSETKEDEELKF